jgi:GTP:adenosylcobinamide-phosphate guanylyltransferase
MKWTAILLAGQRPGEDEFPARYGVAAKALIPIGGEPMLGRVAGTLLASPSVGRILILAQQPQALLTGSLAWMADEPRIGAAESGAGISTSIGAVAGSVAAPFPLLVTTADHALLTSAMVETFLGGAAGADVAFGLVERSLVERVHPETKRTWLRLGDGDYSGANLFALATPASREALAFWSRVEKDRKKALRLISYFGPWLLVRALTRTISLDAALGRIGRRMGLVLKAVRLPFPEAAIDVDKPADVELAEQILVSRSGGSG